MSARGVKKGKDAEREIVRMLQECVDEVLASIPPEDRLRVARTSYTASTRAGGADIMGLPWLSIEVKHHKTATETQRSKWWLQAAQQAKRTQVPVLLYKGNFMEWRCRMPGGHGTDDTWRASIVDITVEDFLVWFRMSLLANFK